MPINPLKTEVSSEHLQQPIDRTQEQDPNWKKIHNLDKRNYMSKVTIKLNSDIRFGKSEKVPVEKFYWSEGQDMFLIFYTQKSSILRRIWYTKISILLLINKIFKQGFNKFCHFHACICWSTDRSNIHRPSLDMATPPISTYAARTPFWIKIEATHGSRQVHCIKTRQKPATNDKMQFPYLFASDFFFFRIYRWQTLKNSFSLSCR